MVDEEEVQLVGGPSGDAAVPRWSRAGKLALGVGAACLVGAAAFAAVGRGRAAEPPMTVRSLLEGAEFEEITTKNLVAMNLASTGAADHDEVRAKVAKSMKAVHAALHTHLLEDHEKLGKVHVTPEQKAAAFRKLVQFGDPSMVRVAVSAVTAAVDNKNAGGDQEALEHRLSDTLQGRLGDIEHLRAGDIASKSEYMPLQEVSGRRLAAADGLDEDVCAHAQTFLESMHEQVGDDMPAAPARLLSAASSGSSDKGEMSFMSCIMKAAPSMPKVAKCVSDNFSEFCKMAMNMLKGKTP